MFAQLEQKIDSNKNQFLLLLWSSNNKSEVEEGFCLSYHNFAINQNM